MIPTTFIKPSHPSQGAFVEINTSDFDPAKGHELYEAPISASVPPLPPLPPPPPPPSADPLAGLAPDWKDQKAGPLRDLAAAVSGRTASNKEEAIAIIEQALAARANPPPPPPA